MPTLPATYPIARKPVPPSASASSENVEKVVNPPRIPVARNVRQSGEISGRVCATPTTTPMQNEPREVDGERRERRGTGARPSHDQRRDGDAEHAAERGAGAGADPGDRG